MGLIQTVAPMGTPITVDQAKAWSRITAVDEAQDELISLNIQTAVRYVESRLSRQLLSATWTYVVDCFPRQGRSLDLPLAPVQSVSSIQYVAEDGTLTTWDSSLWRSDVAGEPARITPVYQGSWPVAQQVIGAVQVSFVAGYGSAAAVPSEYKTVIAMLAAHFYENREATTDVRMLQVPFSIDAQLDLKRWHPNSFAVI